MQRPLCGEPGLRMDALMLTVFHRQRSERASAASKPESTDACGIGGWGRVAAGLVCVCGPARFGACRIGVWGWCGLVAGGVRLRCAGRCGRLR